MNPWAVTKSAFVPGGRRIVRRHHAPLGQVLPYRRAAGRQPRRTELADAVLQGWLANLGDRGLGDTLLGLGLAQALHDATGHDLIYHGPRPDLIRRCDLPITTHQAPGQHLVHTGGSDRVPFYAVPEHPPTWLDLLTNETVEVHAALPMRYYLAAEQALGTRLPASHAPTPTFRSTEPVTPFHVVFVSATSRPDRKDYGPRGFAAIAQALTDRRAANWRFTLVADGSEQPAVDGMDMQAGVEATDCIDLFASAEMVIGNDTGLTHLAALTVRPDGTGPQVVGLYGRHAYTKWTTGIERHHAIATPFSRMLAAADRCPVRDRIEDVAWAAASDLTTLPAGAIAEFAGRRAGWW